MDNQYSALEILKKSTEFLSKYNVKSPKCDAEWIICHFLKIEKLDIYLDRHLITEKETLDKIRDAILRRSKREPLQYILGKVDFYNITLKCDSRALVPRFESELLVELIIKEHQVNFDGRIIDFGTGTGALIISLAKQFPLATCIGIDKSKDSIELAEENVTLNNCNDNVELIHHDWYQNINSLKKADILVSNPPYLTLDEWSNAEPEVKNHDPKDALIASDGGKTDLKQITSIAPVFLKKSGMIALEFGSGQSDFLIENLKERFYNITIKNDLTGKRRFLVGFLKD